MEATCLTVSQYSASGVDTKLCTVADRDVSKGWNIKFHQLDMPEEIAVQGANTSKSIATSRFEDQIRVQATTIQ